MLNILAYSAGRSDLYRWKPFIKDIHKSKGLKLKFILNNAHFDKDFGLTYKIFKQEFKNFNLKKFKKNLSIAENNFVDGKEFETLIKKNKYDFVILLGDRFELINIAQLAVVYGIPIIHIYGGAITTGAIDNQIRNAISKMSHFHLVACDLYKKRLIAMGEDKNRIKVIGIKSIQELISFKDSYNKNDLEKKLKIKLINKIALITVHPVTLYPNEDIKILKNLFRVIKKLNLLVIFTYPNKDIGNENIINEVANFCRKNKNISVFVKVMELDLFSSLLNNVDVMIGNSSSGIVESASFKLPVINIGHRQNGKLMPKNIINVKNDYYKILNATNKSLKIDFKKKISTIKNPYYVKENYKISNLIKKLSKTKDLNIKNEI